jgi:hypothetical protein
MKKSMINLLPHQENAIQALFLIKSLETRASEPIITGL